MQVTSRPGPAFALLSRVASAHSFPAHIRTSLSLECYRRSDPGCVSSAAQALLGRAGSIRALGRSPLLRAAMTAASPTPEEAGAAISLPWYAHVVIQQFDCTYGLCQHQHSRTLCINTNLTKLMHRYIRYTRWKPTSRAEAVAAEKKLLHLCRCNQHTSIQLHDLYLSNLLPQNEQNNVILKLS